MPKVSFILPAYKRRFLHEAIESILAQSCRDFELVVIDDCSPENLNEIVDEFHDERLSYRRNGKNIGGKDLVAAWNHAMEFARGEWCVIASDDDVYLPNYLERMMELHAQFPECDLLQGREAVTDESGKWLRVAQPRLTYSSVFQMLWTKCALRYDQFAAEFCFRRSAWEKIGKFVSFPAAIFSDDATWLLLAKNGVACSPEILMKFRASGENVSLRQDNIEVKVFACRQFKDWIRTFVQELVPSTEEERLIKETVLPKIEYAVFNMARDLLRGVAGFRKWRRMMSGVVTTAAERRQAWRDRYAILDVAAILAKWGLRR